MLLTPPEYEKAIAYALHQLETRLSSHLSYHNLWHTQHDVMPAVIRLASSNGVAAEETQLLRVAAAYHDIGFTERVQGHEIAGMRIAAQTLPQFYFPPTDIERVMGMILATRLPQTPLNLLEEILADADLDVLGRDDFFPRSAALRQELIGLGQNTSWKQWQEQQLRFLKQHSYFTEEARRLRDENKSKHAAALEERVRHL
jgi:predicted metal-dependent HD superfamily phosphohydrolase